jgi:hypothetical protein
MVSHSGSWIEIEVADDMDLRATIVAEDTRVVPSRRVFTYAHHDERYSVVRFLETEEATRYVPDVRLSEVVALAVLRMR